MKYVRIRFQLKRDTDGVAGADKDILAEAERLEVKDKSLLVLVELLLDERILNQLKQYQKLFLRVGWKQTLTNATDV